MTNDGDEGDELCTLICSTALSLGDDHDDEENAAALPLASSRSGPTPVLLLVLPLFSEIAFSPLRREAASNKPLPSDVFPTAASPIWNPQTMSHC